jgi:hypothetical protein
MVLTFLPPFPGIAWRNVSSSFRSRPAAGAVTLAALNHPAVGFRRSAGRPFQAAEQQSNIQGGPVSVC